MAIKVGVNILQSLLSLQLPLTRKPYNKMGDILFKEVFARLYSLRQYVFSMYMYICRVVLYEYTTIRSTKSGHFTSNVMSAFSWSCVYIDIYIFLNTLSGGKSCSVAPGVAVLPWATETVLSPWLAADEARVSHVLSHVVWWKKKKKYEYTTVYYFLIWNKKERNIISSRNISSHLGPIYIETFYIYESLSFRSYPSI